MAAAAMPPANSAWNAHVWAQSMFTYPPHPHLGIDVVGDLLVQAHVLSQTVPFKWAFLDIPHPGALFLVYIPSAQSAQPPTDGYQYMDAEQAYRLTLSNGNIVEVYEHKYGFNPHSDQFTTVVRRRFHLLQSSNTTNANSHIEQLWLIHYLRSPEQDHIQADLAASRPQPPRSYPLPDMPSKQFFLASQISPPVPQTTSNYQAIAAASALNRSSNGAAPNKRPRTNSISNPSASSMVLQQQPQQHDVEGLDEFDMYSLRDGAAVRYKWLSELMEEVLNSAYHVKDIGITTVTVADETPQSLQSYIERLEGELEKANAAHSERIQSFTNTGATIVEGYKQLEKLDTLEEIEQAQLQLEEKLGKKIKKMTDLIVEQTVST